MSNFSDYRKTQSLDFNSEPLVFQKSLRKRWIKSIIRWILTLILYVVFWDKEWVRWTLWVILPMALINLGYLLMAPRLFQNKK